MICAQIIILILSCNSILAAQNANIPLQLVAVTESGGVNAFFNNEICQYLITEGNALADRYKGSFMTFSADQYVKCMFIQYLKSLPDIFIEIDLPFASCLL